MKKITIRILFCCLVVICQKTTAQEISTGRTRDKSITLAVVDDCPKILIGGSTIFEDSYKRFNTYGLQASFTHKLNKRIGLTGDAGINVGSLDGVKYTKTQVLGGVSFLAKANPGQKIVFVPHVLAGVANVGSKSSIFGTTYANNNLNFSVAAGTDIRFAVGPKTVAAVKVDYNPTFATGGIKNNICVGAGIYISLKDCDNIPRTREKPLPPPNPEPKYVCKVTKPPVDISNSSDLKKISDAIEKYLNDKNKAENFSKGGVFKVSLSTGLKIIQGEECCSADKDPVSYTETSGEAKGGVGLSIPLWGIPPSGDSYKYGPFLLIYELKFGIYGNGNLNMELKQKGKEYASSEFCKSCTQSTMNISGTIGISAEATGSVKLFVGENSFSGFFKKIGSTFWGDSKNNDNNSDSYDWKVTEKPSNEVTVSAVAAATVGMGLFSTNSSIGCPEPPPVGFHGKFNLGETKVTFKVKVKLTDAFPPFNFSKDYLVWEGKNYTF